MAFQPVAARQHCSMAEEDCGVGVGVGVRGVLPVASSSSSSRSSRVPSIDSDLCCMEDGGGWDKESPSTATFPCVETTARASSTSVTRLPTNSERSQLRRSRPVDAGLGGGGGGVGSRPFVRKPSGPPAEHVDCLLKMFQAQQKFSPAGVTGSSGGKARCHSVSPFVAERRGLFVAWEVRETSLDMGLSVQSSLYLGHSRIIALRSHHTTGCPSFLLLGIRVYKITFSISELEPASTNMTKSAGWILCISIIALPFIRRVISTSKSQRQQSPGHDHTPMVSYACAQHTAVDR